MPVNEGEVVLGSCKSFILFCACCQCNLLLCEKCPSPSSFNFARLSMLRMLCKKTNDLVVLRICSTKNVGLIHCMRGATHKPGGLTRYLGYNNAGVPAEKP